MGGSVISRTSRTIVVRREIPGHELPQQNIGRGMGAVFHRQRAEFVAGVLGELEGLKRCKIHIREIDRVSRRGEIRDRVSVEFCRYVLERGVAPGIAGHGFLAVGAAGQRLTVPPAAMVSSPVLRSLITSPFSPLPVKLSGGRRSGQQHRLKSR